MLCPRLPVMPDWLRGATALMCRDLRGRLTTSAMLRAMLTNSLGIMTIAVVAKLPNQPMEPVSRRPRLVAKRQFTVFGRKFGDELAPRRFRGVDLAEIANLPHHDPPSRPHRHCATSTYRFRLTHRYTVPR